MRLIPMERSKRLFERALRILAGGVSSPVRSFYAVGGEPLFISNAKGPMIYDVDGNEFIDYVCSWGALILGHADESVVAAIKEQAEKGTSYGAPTEVELRLAEAISQAMPSLELIRFVSSGTEATMSAIRVARGYTGRKRIVKFEGCYHGHADLLLAKAGSGIATYSIPDSAGVPEGIVKDTAVLPYNDVRSLEEEFRREGKEIAAVIVEPVAGNMGVIPSTPDFMRSLRELTERHGSLLIFDEVITGFRVARGGAQSLYGVYPDLTCLGKIIGGGLPVGAYGGREEIMKKVAPTGPVYQAGTLAGNPVCMAAGLATLRRLTPPMYERLEATSVLLADGLKRPFDLARVNATVNRVGSMLGLFFTKKKEVLNYKDARSTDRKLFADFFWRMIERGVYLPPSPFETIFISTAHDLSAIDRTLRSAEASLSRAGVAP